MTVWRRASKGLLAQIAAYCAIVALSCVNIASSPAEARVRHHSVVLHGHPAKHGQQAHRIANRGHYSRGVGRRWATRRQTRWSRTPQGASLTDPAKDAALILDGKTGRVLYARNADVERHPASLTKMMTLYLLFDALKKGQVTLNTPIYISQHAAQQSPTKLGLPAGNTVPADIAIRAAVVLSANDIAVAIGEALGGTESHFAELMTQKARALGMRGTFYHNASGLPDDRQITTASDLGLLARHLAYDFPQYFHYFSLTSFSYRGRTHLGHDNLLGRYAGCDGIKTGYTAASGFNLVSSVVRNGAHIIGVVMGGRSAYRRDTEMVHLLDATFAQINNNPQLVARANIPWQTLAQNSNAQPIIAGFQFATPTVKPAPSNQLALSSPAGHEVDEDTAESQLDQDELSQTVPPAPKPSPPPPSNPAMSVAAAPAPKPLTANPAPPPKPQSGPASPPSRAVVMLSKPIFTTGPSVPAKLPSVIPSPREDIAAQTMLASMPPQPAPVVSPAPRAEINPLSQHAIPLVNPIARSAMAANINALRAADPPDPPPAVTPTTSSTRVAMVANANSTRQANLNLPTAPGLTAPKIAKAAQTPQVNLQGWTIQIGAFADVSVARAQLQAYAQRSNDVLGQAERIIIPFQGVDGKTMYRARFGPFPEQQARAVCATLTQRGQTCFAATMPR
jgi:D-alanyl-D-alanine carboxypeptidase